MVLTGIDVNNPGRANVSASKMSVASHNVAAINLDNACIADFTRDSILIYTTIVERLSWVATRLGGVAASLQLCRARAYSNISLRRAAGVIIRLGSLI